MNNRLLHGITPTRYEEQKRIRLISYLLNIYFIIMKEYLYIHIFHPWNERRNLPVQFVHNHVFTHLQSSLVVLSPDWRVHPHPQFRSRIAKSLSSTHRPSLTFESMDVHCLQLLYTRRSGCLLPVSVGRVVKGLGLIFSHTVIVQVVYV